MSKSLTLRECNEIRGFRELSLAVGQGTNWGERKLVV